MLSQLRAIHERISFRVISSFIHSSLCKHPTLIVAEWGTYKLVQIYFVATINSYIISSFYTLINTLLVGRERPHLVFWTLCLPISPDLCQLVCATCQLAKQVKKLSVRGVYLYYSNNTIGYRYRTHRFFLQRLCDSSCQRTNCSICVYTRLSGVLYSPLPCITSSGDKSDAYFRDQTYYVPS